MLDKKSLVSARLLYYAFFGRVLVFTTREDRFHKLDEILTILLKSPFDEITQISLQAISKYTKEQIAKEYDAVFHSPQPGPIRNTASYYDDGYEISHATLKVKQILAQTHIRKDTQSFKENEDSVGFLMVFMYELLSSQNNDYDSLAQSLFEDIINPFIDQFTLELHSHPKSHFYKHVAVVLSAFMEFERTFYETSKAEKVDNKKVQDGISRSELLRRQTNKARKLSDV